MRPRAGLLLLLLLVTARADPTQEISLIKSLLTNIFSRYKSDMASLQRVVELATGDLHQWRGQVAARLRNIELALGAGEHQQDCTFLVSLCLTA